VPATPTFFAIVADEVMNRPDHVQQDRMPSGDMC